MKRDDALEMAGIALVAVAGGVMIYGLSLIAAWLSLVVAGAFLLTGGLICIGLANRGGDA